MKFINLKNLISIVTLSVFVLLGTSEVVNAQTYRDWRQQRQYERQQREIQRQQWEMQRQQQLELQRQQQLELQRQQQWGYARQQRAINQQYRVYGNGGYYTTDNRGVELLRQAVNRGYQEGYRAGQADRGYRRGYSYNNQSAYRNGNYGYQRYVDASQYQYYFQQGFQRGYEDGYYSRTQYGYRSNNGLNVLGSILSGILNIQSY